MSRVEQFLLGGGHSRASLHIGLVNNMPDAALRATELQFARLLKAAAGSFDVRLRLFPCTPSNGANRRARAWPALRRCRFPASLQHRRADHHRRPALRRRSARRALLGGTGASDRLGRDRHYFHAVLLPGGPCRGAAPGRHRAPAAGGETSGVYDSSRTEDDPLFFKHRAVRARCPNSRRNDIAQADLTAKGYRVLSRLSNGQADIFTREPPGHSRFVFFQGHPEYDPGTLGREYLRDMGRFLHGETAERPALPENYFRSRHRGPADRNRRRKQTWRAIRRSWWAPCRARSGVPTRCGCSATG